MENRQLLQEPRKDAPELNIKWLRAVCTELMPNDSGELRANPAFNAGVRTRLRRGLDRPAAVHSEASLIGYLAKAGLDTERPYQIMPFQIACAVFAWHPHAHEFLPNDADTVRKSVSFGTLCRIMAIERATRPGDKSPRAVDPMDSKFTITPRFERLVQCRKLEKMIVPMRSILKMLAASGMEIPISFRRLLRDLLAWEQTWSSDRGVRMRWMREYWWEDRSPSEEQSRENQNA